MTKQEERLARFASDKNTNEAVFTALLEYFTLENPDKDVHVLAADRLAVDHLRRAWRHILSYGTQPKSPEERTPQVGL